MKPLPRLRIAIAIMAVGITALSCSKSGPGWPGRRFNEARAYLYNLENKLQGDHAIVKKGRLDPSVIGPGRLLTSAQVGRILEVTNQDIGGLVIGLSKTYLPHHGIVFFNDRQEPVAFITLSFDGEGLRIDPPRPFPVPTRDFTDREIESLLEKLRVYRQVIEELGLPIYDHPFDYIKEKRK